MKTTKKTLVIGASENPARYSNLAINMLLEYGHPVVAIGNRNGVVAGVSFDKEKHLFTDIDTVTLYLNPGRQEDYYDYILSLNPKRIIFNPGTENSFFEKLAGEKGIGTLEACTLVLLRTGQY
jgi:predicted CoA-binding protein